MDELILRFDRALRTLAGAPEASRPSPGRSVPEAALQEQDRRHAAALMRVNHVGEVCAQALYEGQGLLARDAEVAARLAQAAREERDHLAWCAERIKELGGRPSLLNPLWYAASFGLGALAAAAGDRTSLGFLAETERQVEKHLSGHLDRLPAADARSRAVVAAMREDEARHRSGAEQAGAAPISDPVRCAMRLMARAMTTLSYRV